MQHGVVKWFDPVNGGTLGRRYESGAESGAKSF